MVLPCSTHFTCAKYGKGASQHKAEFTCPTYTPSPNVVRNGSADAPSILIAYGPALAHELKHCDIPGKFTSLKCAALSGQWNPQVCYSE